MRLSTRVRYGIRMLVDVAAHQGEAPVVLKDVSRRQKVSLNYLRQVMAPLVAAGIMRTERGSLGGVRLARQPGDIRLSLVVRVLDGSTAPVECVDAPSLCARNTECVTRGVWCRLKTAIDGVLESVTIQDLVEQQTMTGQSDAIAVCATPERAFGI